MPTFRLVVVSACFGVLACGPRAAGEPAAESTTAAETTSTTVGVPTTSAPTSNVEGGPTGESTSVATSDTDAATTGTGDSGDPDTFCDQFLDREACEAAVPPRDVFCGWTVSTPVRLSNGMCQLNSASGVCSVLTGGTTTQGCFPPEGCDAEPFFLPGDGETHVILQCGGSLPVGYEPCVLVEPGLFDPPECGCLCDEPGATTGDDSDTTG